ncbi:MAG: phage portal protein family protein [Alphaproteobacteria bacterium]
MPDLQTVAAIAKPPMGEIASTRDGRDITRPFVQGVMPPADPLLQRRFADHALYEEVMRDEQVYSCFQQRRSALLAQEFVVEAGGDDAASRRAAALLREAVQRLGVNELLGRMFYGMFYGYAVAEVMWKAKDGALTFDDIKVRRARRFRFGEDAALRLLTRANPVEGEPLPPRKFWLFAAPSDNDDAPDGIGLGYWCYWPVFFKRNGLKFWLIHLEKFGMPTALGTYDLSANADDQRKLLDAVQAIQTDSGIIVPEGMKIDLIEAARGGHGDYEALYERMDRAISKVILSQTMTTDEGSSRAQAEVHERVLGRLAREDAMRITTSFNCGPARWLSQVNEPKATPPRLVISRDVAETVPHELV